MNKKDEFIIEYLRILEALRQDIKYYIKFTKQFYSRKRVYKDIKKANDMLKNHIDKCDVFKGYNEDNNFNETIIKWNADLNFLTAAALRYGMCIKILYRNVNAMNNLVCNYFKENQGN